MIHFLNCLNEEFSVVKSQILLLDPLPSLNTMNFKLVFLFQLIMTLKSLLMLLKIGYQVLELIRMVLNLKKEFVHLVTKQVILLILVIASMEFHLICRRKVETMRLIMLMREIFAPPALTCEQYNTLVSLLQVSSISKQYIAHASNQVSSSLSPSHPTVDDKGNISIFFLV